MDGTAPLAIDLYAGLGGWTAGLLTEGWRVVGFDIERHVYGDHCYPAQLVVQDVLTLDGAQFCDADLIVASPPCQFFSYTAMPWSRAKALAADVRASPERLEKELALFNACFRIQREACEAAGRHIPLVVENVKGAQPWVGRARWNFGSYYLWGDVPALMPPIHIAGEQAGVKQHGSGHAWFDKALDQRRKNPGIKLSDIGFNVASTQKFGHMVEGVKIARTAEDKRQHIGTKRKFASAMIAKIPFGLSRHVATVYHPRNRITMP